MTADEKALDVTPGSELERLLEAADDGPVTFDRAGIRYRVTRDAAGDIVAGYDPERFRTVLDEVAGSWSDLDTDTIIEQVYRWREEGSRPADRLQWPS